MAWLEPTLPNQAELTLALSKTPNPHLPQLRHCESDGPVHAIEAPLASCDASFNASNMLVESALFFPAMSNAVP